MQRVTNPIFELYALTPEEIAQAQQHLAEPLVQAYISTLIAQDATDYILADLYAETKAHTDPQIAASKLLIDNAFFKGAMAIVKRLLIPTEI